MIKIKKYTLSYVKEYINSKGYTLLDDKYINCKEKLRIKSPDGYIFNCSFDNFKRGKREPQTQFSRMTSKSRMSYDTVKKIVESKGFELLSTEYKNSKTPLRVICKNGHNSFKNIENIQRGHQCLECSRQNKQPKKTTKEYKTFIENLRQGQYSLVGEYHGTQKTNTYMHKKCGNTFSMLGNNFNKGQGCPFCKSSKGEKTIYNLLMDNKINFKKEFSIVIDSKTRRFDFYLYDFKMAIEYDGRQHHDKKNKWYSEEGLIRDKQKDLWCVKHDMKMIRVPYTMDTPIKIVNYINKNSNLNLTINKNIEYCWFDNYLEIADDYLNNYCKVTALKYHVSQYYVEKCFLYKYGMGKKKYLKNQTSH